MFPKNHKRGGVFCLGVEGAGGCLRFDGGGGGGVGGGSTNSFEDRE